MLHSLAVRLADCSRGVIGKVRLVAFSSRPTSFGQSVAPRMPDDELADLMSDSAGAPSSTTIPSPWTTNKFSTDSILFPNELLQSSRAAIVDVKAVDRLAHLWSLSSSHGVSWDELDDAFLAFHREYIQAENDWSEHHEEKWDFEYARSAEALRKTLSGEETDVVLTMNRRRGKIRRMTYARLARMRFKQVVKPFQLGPFTEYMKAFVSQRMVRREQAERALHTPPAI